MALVELITLLTLSNFFAVFSNEAVVFVARFVIAFAFLKNFAPRVPHLAALTASLAAAICPKPGIACSAAVAAISPAISTTMPVISWFWLYLITSLTISFVPNALCLTVSTSDCICSKLLPFVVSS